MIDEIIRDMDRKGETERKVGHIKVVRYRPSPIEKLNNIGKGIKMKERLEKEREIEGRKKASPRQWARTMEKWGEIENSYKDNAEEYLNLTQGK